MLKAMQSLINKYKRIRKNKLIKSCYTQNYAFVGIGNHSLNNLYPVIDYLKAELKYIVVKSKETADTINESYKNVKGTTDFDKVLNDNSIKGIFISASPDAHFNLVKKALEADKHVFVEKPPCMDKKELEELEKADKKSKGELFTGLQKRYAPVYSILKKKIKTSKPIYYNLNYFAGNYPEGDALIDLFIHPIDIANFLFGDAKIEYLKKITNNKGVETILLEINHENNVHGRLELSTDFWWARSTENITVNTVKNVLYTEGINTLKYIDKPKSIMNVPLEKVKAPSISDTYLYQKNNFLPVREHNDLYAAGYFGEIQAFLNLCESGGENTNNITSLKNTYDIIEKIKSE